MSKTRVTCLKIDSFRRFHDIEIQLGEHVTLIAGENGTAKSTLLGMLAQPFSFGYLQGKSHGKADMSSYTDNYHGLILSDYIDLTGKNFSYDCDDIFRLSRKHDNVRNKYQYETVLDGVPLSENSPLMHSNLLTKNRIRKTDKGVRFVTGPGTSHKRGEGNYPHPVIYLGLNRLWPLAESKECSFTGENLSKDEMDWYVDKYNEVLCLEEYDNEARYMDTLEKGKAITPESKDYDGESCSAGQDNLGRILTAILSFRNLKESLGSEYRGGLLLIDEADATLHPSAQVRLLELLCKATEELSLQIIGTTHSLTLLEKAYKSVSRQQTNVIYLSRCDGSVVVEPFDSYEQIRDHLHLESTPLIKRRTRKVSVIFEDEVGKAMFHQICGSKLRNYITVKDLNSIGAGDMKRFASLSKSIPVLSDVIFVVDGDMINEWRKPPRNLITLPGYARPETLIFRHLYNMTESNPFWKSVNTTYSRRVAITKYRPKSIEKGDEKQWVKTWYQKQSRYWGRENKKVFKSWVQDNKGECLDFCNKFIRLLKNKFNGDIPPETIERAVSPLK
jgi:predicted ATPase